MTTPTTPADIGPDTPVIDFIHTLRRRLLEDRQARVQRIGMVVADYAMMDSDATIPASKLSKET